MDKFNLKVDKREVLGRKVKALRKEGVLPANVYGKKVKSQAIQIAAGDFDKVYKKAGETGIVELVMGSTKNLALIHNVQVDPVSDEYLHVDFFKVSLKEKVTANVPLELIGESPAEKQGLGTVVQYIDELEVEALPTDLPDKIEVDLAALIEVDQAITVADVKVDKKGVDVKHEKDQLLVKVEPARKEEEEVKEEEVEEKTGEEEVKEEGKDESSEEKKDEKASSEEK